MRVERGGGLRVRVLGAVEAGTASGPVPLGPSLRTVLAALAVDAGRVVPADVLVDRAWGGARPAGSTVHSAVSRVRAALDAAGAPGVLVTRSPGYRLLLPADGLDAATFERHLGVARAAGDPAAARHAAEEALALWRGPAFADVAAPFARDEARRLEDRRLEALELRARADLALGRHREVVADLADLVGAHPWHEELRAALALALYRSSRQAEALEVLDEGRRLLAEELGLDPGPELRRLRELVLRQDPSLGAPSSPAPSSPPPPAPSVPVAATELLGREGDVRRVGDLLRGARLVTLTGTGGVGKTRLAAAVARAARPAFPGGTWFVPLATLTHASAVLPALARAVGLPVATDEDVLDDLAGRLAGQRSLLVLDNCEHLLEAAADVAALVARCPDLHVLATSRAPLRVGGEVEHRVEPLAAAPARDLFVQRARAVAPGFRLDERTRGPVDAVCRAVAGIPLALELAAAKVRVLAVEDLPARLDQALAGGARDLPERQRTMRATLDWSCGLLDAPARALFARLSVFAGGWTLAELEAVEGPDVLGHLETLVEHSLVAVDFAATAAGLPVRYAMLEPVRQHAHRALAGPELDRVARAHALAYLDLAERATVAYRGPGQVRWLRRMEAEHANVLAAVERALAAGDADLAGRLVWASWLFWWVRGPVRTGRRCAEAVAAAAAGRPATPGTVRALTALATMAYAQGDVPAARDGWDRAVAAAGEVAWDDPAGHPETVAQGVAGRAICALAEGDLQAAAEGHRRAVELAGALPPDGWGPWLVRLNRVWWGTAAWRAGRIEEARAHVGAGLALARQAGDRLATYLALFNLALVEADDDPARAAAALLEGLRLSEQTGDLANLAHVLDALVVLLLPRTPPDVAPDVAPALAVLLAAAAQARDTVGYVVYAYYPRDPAAVDAAAAVLAGVLEPHQLQQATGTGRAASPAELVATASAAVAAVVAAVTAAPAAAPTRPS